MAGVNDHVLILDDERSILEILGQHLSLEGYPCQSTVSPIGALEMLRQKPYALLITDLKMPEMNGIDVVKQAKEISPDIAIIVVTALIDVSNAIQALRIGADDYLLKPFNLTEISLSVSRSLEKRRLILENRNYQEELERRVDEATRDLQRTNAELLGTKEYLENLIHSTVDAIITTDVEGNINFANTGALHMLGYFREELVGRPINEFFSGGIEELRYVKRVITEDKPLQNYETELRRRDGATVPVNMSLSLVRGADGRIVSMLAISKDITEQKRLEQELKEMSIKDSLTGLYNQRYFYDRLEAEIERARRQGHPLSLLLFDIDQFKSYNDAHGHLEGDYVLQEIGRVVLECTREHVDTGFRYGGDEFTVILPEAGEQQALQIAERIRTSFEAKRFDLLTVSIGLMPYKGEYSLKKFIQFTDSMMYDAKRSGGNRVYVYRPEDGSQEEMSVRVPENA
jgi:diguanylate cyclase (GGDEF)-like protein/PAS domain S-box-containing protein